jgi:hypothetical protein
MGLILGTLFVSCSEDSDTITPKPQPGEFEITTAAIPDAYYCTPYHVELEAAGGTAPYTWALAAGSDPLPNGLTMNEYGEITGVVDGPGEYTVTVTCTDASDTPETLNQSYTFSSEEPANPSLAIFFDGDASVCQATSGAFQQLDCYVFIMTEGSDLVPCAQACEFMMTLTDADGNAYDPGTEFHVLNVTHPSYVSVTMGDPFSGIAIAFNQPRFGPNPVHVATFGIMLMEDLSQLAVKFQPYPDGHLGVVTCETGFPVVDVTGREAAINY